MASAAREPRSRDDGGCTIVAVGHACSRASREMVASRLRLRPRGRHAPISNSNLKRVVPKRLCRRVRSRKGSRPTVSSTVCPRVVGLPLSACRCRHSGRSLLVADGLPLPSGCRFAAVGLRAAVGLPRPLQIRTSQYVFANKCCLKS